MRDNFVKALTKGIEEGRDSYILSGDLGFGAFDKFRKQYPKRFINAGIAEQSMIGIGCGLAKAGKEVFAYSILPFAVYRPFEFIRNDAAYNDIPIRVVGVGVGFDYDLAGNTHFGLEDIQVMTAISNLIVISPSDGKETEILMDKMKEINKPIYLRLSKKSEESIHSMYKDIIIGKALKLREGKDILILSTGKITETAIKVCELLKDSGLSAELLEYHTLKPFDKSALYHSCEGKKLIITIEENTGGFNLIVSRALHELGITTQLHEFYLPDEFPHMVGSREWMLKEAGLSAEEIFAITFEVYRNV